MIFNLFIISLIFSTELFAEVNALSRSDVSNMEYIRSAKESSIQMLIAASEKYMAGAITKDQYIKIALQASQMANFSNKLNSPIGTETCSGPNCANNATSASAPAFGAFSSQKPAGAEQDTEATADFKSYCGSGSRKDRQNISRADALTVCELCDPNVGARYALCIWGNETIKRVGSVPPAFELPQTTNPETPVAPVTNPETVVPEPSEGSLTLKAFRKDGQIEYELRGDRGYELCSTTFVSSSGDIVKTPEGYPRGDNYTIKNPILIGQSGTVEMTCWGRILPKKTVGASWD